ncbi:glycosyl hydrolase 2 galactose-binding domain-containing protein [Occallatibacter riparius]|uniref:Glycoside hydrolase family 2 n=1 Tax=Occallatibacter riparius TaxID=1002689 RepID=A0A9J7BH55_9BACT|nr:LamG-like jellyroll fold domain-containing protein [Occallatibacter riparius]UWZ81731.1 glycoside hydrolase family 2 [Occallatibacter riparius]
MLAWLSRARLDLCGFGSAVLLALSFTGGRSLPAQAPPVPQEVYGPWSAVILPDGPGLMEPAPGEWGGPSKVSKVPSQVLTGDAKWSLAFWFYATDPANSNGLTLLAGIGDPGAKDARYVAFVDGRMSLWLGRGQDRFVTAGGGVSEGWHFAVATGDGNAVALYEDGKAVASSGYSQGNVAAQLWMGPAGGEHHFGGKIAYLRIYDQVLTPEQVKHMAAEKPNFDTPEYTEASAHWPVQVRAMAGQTEPQDPMTLPRSKVAPQKPVAKALRAADLKSELAGQNPWTIRGGWKLAAVPDVGAAGEEISKAGFAARGWMAATVPGTVLTTMIDRGIYPDPDYGLNNLAIPDKLARQDYWYRVEFPSAKENAGRRMTLTFNGINYAAEVWLNGQRLGDVKGAFIRGSFDVTDELAKSGMNALAVKVSPPPHPGLAQEESIKAGPGDNGGIQMLDGPTFLATEGWDWIPTIRDRNTGIWQDVTLRAEGPVSVGDVNVITTLPKADNSEADIEIEAPLVDTNDKGVEGELTASFDDVKVTKHLRIGPGETVVRLTPAEFPQLKVQNPKLWWPNGYGDPALHHLTVSFAQAGVGIDSEQEVDFGMREVSYELSLLDQTGHMRRVEVLPSRTHDQELPLINGRHEGIRRIDDKTPDEVFPTGTPGWLRDLLMHAWVQTLQPGAEGSASVRAVEGGWPGTDLVIKVNGVRIAARGGNWGMDDTRKRVSVENLEPYFRLHRDAHVNMIRNWMGQNTEDSFYALADKYGLMVWNDFWESTQTYNLETQDPQLFLNNARDTILRYRHHPSIVVWCGRNEGVPQPILNEGLESLARTLDHTRYYTGSSNMVNLRGSGPYQLEPLAMYYRINRGFSVELGIPSVPTLEGIKAFIPEADRWPISDTWAYHDWHQLGNGTVKPFMEAMATEFGAPTSLEDFERKAQMIDYAAHRAIFEGFAAHLWQPNSARMIWMTQSAWPSMEWNFLGHDYDTQSSFYGTQKACEPVHAQLNLEDGSVDLINLNAARSLKVRMRVVGLDGKTLSDETSAVQAAANARTAVAKLDLEKIADGHAVLVKFDVMDENGKPVSDNFYWWAKQESTLQELSKLGDAKLTTKASADSVGGERRVTVKIKNDGAVPAILIKLTLTNAVNGERILPAYYSENYVSILPGEERSVEVEFPQGSEKPALGIRGWNVASGNIAVQ